MRLKVSNVCQLLDKSKYNLPHTESGLTFTAGTDGSIIVNGTCTSTVWANISSFELNPEHTFILIGCPGTNVNDVALYTADAVTGDSKQWEEGQGSLVTGNWYKHKNNELWIRILTGYVCNNLTFKPQLYDLTEMYGAGNEPTTVAQFRQDFPNEMYDYSPVCWKKFRRLKYIANKEPVQLLDKSDFKTVVSKGVTATPNTTNGMWTISGAATASEYLQIGVYYPGTDFNIGDKLFLRHSNIDNSVYFPYAAWYDKDNKYLGEKDGDGTFSVTNPETAYIACYFTTRTVADINVTTQVQLFNLTRMYGKGNEPTADEFYAQYPGFDYSVNKYNYLTLNRGKYIANKEPVQLLDKSRYPATITNVGVTFTNNGDGTITLNGTNTGGGANLYTFMKVSVKAGHYYYIYSGQAGTWGTCMFTVDRSISADKVDGHIGFQGANSFDNCAAYLFIGAGATFNNYVVKPQFFDLTEMYGAGNEPKTVAQFKADFPNELYDYNPYNAITFR